MQRYEYEYTKGDGCECCSETIKIDPLESAFESNDFEYLSNFDFPKNACMDVPTTATWNSIKILHERGCIFSGRDLALWLISNLTYLEEFKKIINVDEIYEDLFETQDICALEKLSTLVSNIQNYKPKLDKLFTMNHGWGGSYGHISRHTLVLLYYKIYPGLQFTPYLNVTKVK